MLNRVACDPKLAETLGRGLSSKGEVGTPVVILVLPSAELLGELSRVPEDGAAIELVLIGSVTPFHLPVAFRAASRDLTVGETEIPQVPGEVGPELGAMVGLNPLNSHGKSAAQFLDEVGRRADRVVRVNPEDPIARGFVDSRELIEAPSTELEVLHVDLDGLGRARAVPGAAAGRGGSAFGTRAAIGGA